VSNQSIGEKALLLASEARRVKHSQTQELDAFAVTKKIEDLRKNLGQLETVLAAARRLNANGTAIDLHGVDDGLAALRTRAGTGLPPNKSLDNASKAVGEVSTRIGVPLKQAWLAWCDARLAELRRDRIEMLEGKAAVAATASLRELEKLRGVEPRAAAVAQFLLTHESLRERLDAAPLPDPELLELLGRLSGGTTLDALTDTDLALIRRYGIGGTIEVRRRLA
jgi:hypothetical protein